MEARVGIEPAYAELQRHITDRLNPFPIRTLQIF